MLFLWRFYRTLGQSSNPYAKKTKFTYDARGRTKTVTNALNHVTQYNYFDDTQRKVEMIYPNLDKITYKYDIRRTLESVTDERGKVTGYEFDPQYRLKKITDPLGHVREFGYDLMSHMTSYKDPLGNVTDYAFDDFDRLWQITRPAAVTGGTRLTEKFEYDKIGRIKKYADTANRFTQYGYDDTTRTNTVTDAANKITTTKYNQRFQTVEVKDAINQIYTFAYDPLGRLLSQTRAGGTMSFEYDEVGNRKKRTDYAGRVTNYSYDNLNRLKEIEYDLDPLNGVAKPKSVYNYDDISRLTSATNDAGTVTFNYDNRNRVIDTTDVFGRVIAYEYERTSTVSQKRLKLDGSMYAAYNFDDAGRLANLVNSSDSTTITFGYDNEDKITSRVFPNGVTTTYEYYNNDLLKRLKDASTSTVLFDRQYAYNSANQIDTLTDLSGTKTYGYDLVDRLKTVHTNGTQTEFYNYDDVGNRTSSHLSATYGYQAGKFNQLASTATASYQFDLNGNTIQKSEGSNFWRYVWNYENRMTEASTRKNRVRFRYDALGRRVERNFNSGKERNKFTHDGHDVLFDDNAGELTKYLNGLGIDNKLRVQAGSDVKYFLTDHLGTTNGLADQNASLTSSATYDSFGNSANNLTTRYQYTGREFDGFTGQYYYRARFYDANPGRFTSEDPIGFGGGDINLYGYVRNRPNMLTDPSGKIIPVIVVGGVVVVTLILTSPSYVNAPGPRDPVYTPQNPLLVNAAGGAACGYMLNRFVSPLISRLFAGAGDDIITLGISQGPTRISIRGYAPPDPLPQQNIGGISMPAPHPEAQGPHTMLGTRVGSDGIPYRQSATFPGPVNGQNIPWSRVDWTSHGRGDHLFPHQHPLFLQSDGTWRYGPMMGF